MQRSRQLVRNIALVLCAALALQMAVGSVVASKSAAVRLDTTTALGPGTVGTWSSTGAFVDAGTFVKLGIHFSAAPAPDFQVTHVKYLFRGAEGTFEVHADFKEGPTANPDIFWSDGTWNIQGGTGAYARLHGGGDLAGTVNETDPGNRHADRVFSGDIHFD